MCVKLTEWELNATNFQLQGTTEEGNKVLSATPIVEYFISEGSIFLYSEGGAAYELIIPPNEENFKSFVTFMGQFEQITRSGDIV